jgi:hypothetical protein
VSRDSFRSCGAGREGNGDSFHRDYSGAVRRARGVRRRQRGRCGGLGASEARLLKWMIMLWVVTLSAMGVLKLVP